jgi:hypothetical protein
MTTHKHSTKAAVALALTLSALSPAAAAARLDLNPPRSTSAASAAPTASTVAPTPRAQIIRVTAPGGFDWGDAGIGAAGGLGLSLLALGGGAVVTRRGRGSSGRAAAAS